jgi:transcriptional regulator of acetoin/glycerol metabolism
MDHEQATDESLDDPTVDLGDPGTRVHGGRLEDEVGNVLLQVGDLPRTIGRSRDVALFIDDHGVSKRHAELEPTPEGVRLRDLGSRNGTFVEVAGNTTRISDVLLDYGCTIRLGHARFRFVPEPLAPVQNSARRFGGLLGTTPEMLDLFANLERHAGGELSVLIGGETGTGKERAARAIHNASPRRTKPFVALSCATVPEFSIDDELFGHVRGAFRDAHRDRAGAFVEADGGTLFFDDVAEMSLPMQAKLLRILQDKEVRPLGADRPRRVNVRTLFATHADLQTAVHKGLFRTDLYVRIAQVCVAVPPLRRRLDDLPELLADILKDLNRPEVRFDKSAMAALMAHTWPGNVRELHNVIGRALQGFAGSVLSERDVAAAATFKPIARPLDGGYRKAKEDLDRKYYSALYVEHHGNVSRIAQEAGTDRATVTKVLCDLGLHARPEQKGPAKTASRAKEAASSRAGASRKPQVH